MRKHVLTKASIMLSLIMLATAFLIGCSSGKDNDDPIPQEAEGNNVHLKITLAANENSPMYEGAVRFAELVEEKSEGRITGEVFANSSLASGNQTKAIEMIQNGSIDVGFVALMAQSSINQELGALAIPWLWNDYEQSDAAFEPGEPVFQYYYDYLMENDLTLLGFAENGHREITNNKREVRTPEDMNGLKMRVLGNDMVMDVYRELGANVVDINFSELFTAMQQGTVDGQENPVATIMVPGRYFEVQDYLTIWGGPYEPIIVEMSKKTWDSLSEEDQKIVQEAGHEATLYERERSRAMTESGIEEFEKNGTTVTILTEEEIAAFKERVQSVLEGHKAKFDPELIQLLDGATQ